MKVELKSISAKEERASVSPAPLTLDEGSLEVISAATGISLSALRAYWVKAITIASEKSQKLKDVSDEQRQELQLKIFKNLIASKKGVGIMGVLNTIAMPVYNTLYRSQRIPIHQIDTRKGYDYSPWAGNYPTSDRDKNMQGLLPTSYACVIDEFDNPRPSKLIIPGGVSDADVQTFERLADQYIKTSLESQPDQVVEEAPFLEPGSPEVLDDPEPTPEELLGLMRNYLAKETHADNYPRKIKIDLANSDYADLNLEYDASLSKSESDWWRGLSVNQKRTYLTQHPNSKYAKAYRAKLAQKQGKPVPKNTKPGVRKLKGKKKTGSSKGAGIGTKEAGTLEQQAEAIETAEPDSTLLDPGTITTLDEHANKPGFLRKVANTVSSKISEGGLGATKRFLSGSAKEGDTDKVKKVLALGMSAFAMAIGGAVIGSLLGPGVLVHYLNWYMESGDGFNFSGSNSRRRKSDGTVDDSDQESEFDDLDLSESSDLGLQLLSASAKTSKEIDNTEAVDTTEMLLKNFMDWIVNTGGKNRSAQP